MQTRRDQVQAQSYVLGRVTAALVGAEPDGAESPHRRTVTGNIAGALLAVLGVAGFVIFGMFSPGSSDSWRAPGVLVVEKETGSRFVYVNGRLHPVLNYASALLLFAEAPKVVTVSRKSLREAPHGAAVGIVAAPDSLPVSGSVERQTWTVCALMSRDAAGSVVTGTALAVEATSSTGPAIPLGRGEALVVSGGGETFLIWQGRRLRMAQPWMARALGYDGAALPVEPGWLDSVPAGPDLGPALIPSRGSAGRPVDGRPARIGSLFVARTPGAPERRFVLRPDGLAELTPLAYAIVAADPQTTAQVYGGQPALPRELSPGALTQLPVSRGPVLPAGLPETPPRLRETDPASPWCVRQDLSGAGVDIVVGSPMPEGFVVRDAVGMTRDSRTATAVKVAAGEGGLVRPGRVDQAPGAGFYLVTDAGVKYPVATAETAKRLGFPPGTARPVPRRLLEMLPTGPLLELAPAGG